MRADRLITLMMLLQLRGRMTAAELAAELEVSERTIYRDFVALSAAGIPVYAETGRQGGYALVERYRTSLTGLSEGEMRALFMLSIPGPLAQLGLGQELKSALLKLSAALPQARRGDEERVRQRFYLDPEGWRQAEEQIPHLHTIQQAIWGDRQLYLTYRPIPTLEMEQLVEPYGLVAKAGIWYVVWMRKGQTRVLRVANVLAARLADETFKRSTEFDLVAFWKMWCQERESNSVRYPVKVRAAPGVLPRLEAYRNKDSQVQTGEPAELEWVTLNLSFESLEEARSQLLAFGGAVEVLAPAALRLSIQDYAVQISTRYHE